MQWVQLSPFSHYNELRCGQIVCGNLLWEKDNFSISGRGTTAQGSWLLKYTRYVQPNLEIHETESGEPAGGLHLDLTGRGLFAQEDGQQFAWLPVDRWGLDWQFTNSAGIPMLYFQPRKKWLTISAQIQIAGEIPGEPTLSLLVLSGWFNLVLNAKGGYAGVTLFK